MALAPKKVGLIHVAKTRLGLEEDDYRALLWRAAGVESARELDEFGFEAVMDELRRLGFVSDWAKAGFGLRPGMASDAQIHMIRRLWGEFTDGKGAEAGLGRWLERQFKVSALRFLDADTAQKAIGALKIMLKRRAA